MKRADLPTEKVLATIFEHGIGAFDVLSREYPEKIILAAYERDVNKGLLDYGTWLGHPWIEPEVDLQIRVNAMFEHIRQATRT